MLASSINCFEVLVGCLLAELVSKLLCLSSEEQVVFPQLALTHTGALISFVTPVRLNSCAVDTKSKGFSRLNDHSPCWKAQRMFVGVCGSLVKLVTISLN